MNQSIFLQICFHSSPWLIFLYTKIIFQKLKADLLILLPRILHWLPDIFMIQTHTHSLTFLPFISININTFYYQFFLRCCLSPPMIMNWMLLSYKTTCNFLTFFFYFHSMPLIKLYSLCLKWSFPQLATFA